jgi:hypothetical protein
LINALCRGEDGYPNWGVMTPEAQSLCPIAGLGNDFERVDRSRERAFVEMQNVIRDAIEQPILRADLPLELISKTMAASAGATMELIVLQPAMANKYRNGGFEVYRVGNNSLHPLDE